MVQTKSGTVLAEHLAIPTESIAIVQLASTSENYTELEREYLKQSKHYQKFYYLIKQAYIHGRKACVVIIVLRNSFYNLFKDITPARAIYTFFKGKTITGIEGPSAGIIEKIDLYYYYDYEFEEKKADYVVYSGKFMNIFF